MRSCHSRQMSRMPKARIGGKDIGKTTDMPIGTVRKGTARTPSMIQ
jgi:hypothetical protein